MPDRARVIIYDPHQSFTEELFGIFEKIPGRVRPRSMGMFSEFQQHIKRHHADVCLLVLDDLSERRVRDISKALLESSELILLSETPKPDLAETCTKLGASYHFSKPIDSVFLEEVLVDILADLSAENASGEPNLLGEPLDKFGLIYGNSRAMRRMYRKIRKVSGSDTSVLLVGESGSGKELAAQTVHILSPRREGPFLGVNCSAIARELLESELFGHKRGSFTGAERNHTGYFERASGGTLFLDEVTEMEPQLQTNLLRVLETGHFTPVGGEEEIQSNVRIVAATNRDPQEAVAQGVLREDLFFRLSQFPIRVPPLRERVDDIPRLADFFLQQHNRDNETRKTFSKAVIDKISTYSWPGNVRELRHLVEHAYIMGRETIELKDLPPHVIDAHIIPQHDSIVVPVGTSLSEAERQIILATLDFYEGNKQETAERLGVSLKTLYNKLKKFDEEEVLQ